MSAKDLTWINAIFIKSWWYWYYSYACFNLGAEGMWRIPITFLEIIQPEVNEVGIRVQIHLNCGFSLFAVLPLNMDWKRRKYETELKRNTQKNTTVVNTAVSIPCKNTVSFYWTRLGIDRLKATMSWPIPNPPQVDCVNPCCFAPSSSTEEHTEFPISVSWCLWSYLSVSSLGALVTGAAGLACPSLASLFPPEISLTSRVLFKQNLPKGQKE